MKSGMSLSPITSALLGVTSAYLQSPSAVELGKISPCSSVTWILPCLAEVGSEHPFPSHCHTAFSAPRKGFGWGKTFHTSHSLIFLSLGMSAGWSGGKLRQTLGHMCLVLALGISPLTSTLRCGDRTLGQLFLSYLLCLWSSLCRELEPVSELSSCEFEAAM